MIVTQNLNTVIVYAQGEAERLLNKRVEPNHLLLAIIRLGEGSAFEVLKKTAFDAEQAKAHIEQEMQGQETMVEPVTRSAQTDRILRIAEGISREYQSEAVGTIHLLLAIMRERINATAAYLEREWNIHYQRLVDIYGQPYYAPENTTDSEQNENVNDNNWQPQREQKKSAKN